MSGVRSVTKPNKRFERGALAVTSNERKGCAMRRIVIACMAVLMSSAAASADGVLIHNGFVTGQEFMRATDAEQRRYIMGLVDGLFLAPLVRAPKAKVIPIEKCVEGMTDEQLNAIFLKYLRNNPERWHQSAHAAFYTAIVETCGIKTK